MSIPPAHRRLVPRKTHKEPDDLEATVKNVVIQVDEPADEDNRRSRDSMEMTVLREATADVDMPESIEPTAERHIEVSAADEIADDDDDDASETMALQQVPAHFVAETNPFADGDEPTALKPAGSPSVRPGPPLDRRAPDRNERNAPIQAGRGIAGRLNTQQAADEDNGFADSEPTSLKQQSQLGMEDRPTAHLSPAEVGLLSAMSEGHEPSRLKYVDWLERRGEHTRAEFLRLDYALAAMPQEHPRYEPTRHRMREIAPLISVDWRSRVARSLIENCGAFGVGCPAYWRALPSDTDDVRRCSNCADDVYYCVSLDLARSRVQQGQRVAVDVTCDRFTGDLAPACGACHAQVPPNTRFCPHCGHVL